MGVGGVHRPVIGHQGNPNHIVLISKDKKEVEGAGVMGTITGKPTFLSQSLYLEGRLDFPLPVWHTEKLSCVVQKVTFSRQVRSSVSLSFALCHLFFSLKHFDCLISLQHQQCVT